MSSMFYLVQRMTRRDNPHATGFDAAFDLDYMGSAEFEFGAIPTSLQRMRAHPHLTVHTGTVTRNGHARTVHVIADADIAHTIPGVLTDWLTDPYPRGQENSRFQNHVDGTATAHDLRTNAWWDITNDVMFTLDADIAADLLRAVQPTQPTREPQ